MLSGCWRPCAQHQRQDAASPDGKLFALSLVNERAQDRPVTLLLNWKLP